MSTSREIGKKGIRWSLLIGAIVSLCIYLLSGCTSVQITGQFPIYCGPRAIANATAFTNTTGIMSYIAVGPHKRNGLGHVQAFNYEKGERKWLEKGRYNMPCDLSKVLYVWQVSEYTKRVMETRFNPNTIIGRKGEEQ